MPLATSIAGRLDDAASDHGTASQRAEVRPISPVYYPVSLDLRGRDAVVIGGGPLAEAKTLGLVAAGARVVVIARTTTARIASLSQGGVITLHPRDYRSGDLGLAFLAIVALESTEERALHPAIWREAQAKRVLLNSADDAQHCHFIAPAIHRRGAVSVAVSTSGASPALATRLRDGIARLVGPEYGDLAALLASLRPLVARALPAARPRAALWKRIVDSNALRLMRDAGPGAARQRIERMISRATADGATPAERPTARGIVYIVGAGPGAPGLITLRGRAALRRADVVVYDRLVDRRILAVAPISAKCVYAGKDIGSSRRRQSAINRLLVRLAREGNVVVRLKGGDPFVFGRGAEECSVLRAARVRVRVVPGVSAAIAAPAAAEIPVTHRGLASAFAVVTARGADDTAADVDWRAVARIPTVVVLMGLAALERVTAELLASAKPSHTPAAVITRATLPDEHVVLGTLGSIARDAAVAGIRSPATLIVGDVVRLGRSPAHARNSVAQESQS